MISMSGKHIAMPDSPKCEDCQKLGLIGQTYKVAGKPLFQCRDCKRVYRKDEFEAEAFTWRETPKSYAKWQKSRSPSK